MDRRTLLHRAGVAGCLAAFGGGLWVRRDYATNQLRRTLLAEGLPLLTDKAHGEFESIPGKCREEIREWFHGKALNVAPFVNEICSNGYREKLHACRTVQDQHQLLLVSFFGKVATDAEIMSRVQTIAVEVGQELDLNWAHCCRSLGSKWNVHVKDYGGPLDLKDLMGRVDQAVAECLTEAIQVAIVGADARICRNYWQDWAVGTAACPDVPNQRKACRERNRI